jgi:hypothetical protein
MGCRPFLALVPGKFTMEPKPFLIYNYSIHGRSMEDPWKIHERSMKDPWKILANSVYGAQFTCPLAIGVPINGMGAI